MKAGGSIRRSKSNDGATSGVHQVLPVRNSLINAVLGAPPPLERQVIRTFAGPKPRKPNVHQTIPDEVVLEARRLRHWKGMSVAKIAEKLGLNFQTCWNLCQYTSRVHLDPARRPH